MGESLLPAGVQVLERGWLSANMIVLDGARPAVVDTGYCTHAKQTLELVARVLQGRAPALIVNTHLHSDHCGGNAALQAEYPGARTLIPPGDAAAVRAWDEDALTYRPTGQLCPRFRADDTLRVGQPLPLGELHWEVLAAPGHDPHSVVLFEPRAGVLISADALWENGFGVVFPELEGQGAFDAVAATLDVIERLQPRVVIPGHGAVFTDVTAALARARSRLEAYRQDPARHAAHAAKVLLKFKLLELQEAPLSAFLDWAQATPYFGMVHERFFSRSSLRLWAHQIVGDLVRSGAARLEGDRLANR